MCGIFAYTGNKNAAPILIDGLKALEYRGYDSAGVFVISAGCTKAVGPVQNLADKLKADIPGNAGIAHTRWATHGVPSETNAHPHADCSGKIWLVHNGIVENYKELKNKLSRKRHKFRSETDSEILAHLIEENLKQNGRFEEAVRKSLKAVRGTYGIAVINGNEPDKIVAARLGSPILLGIGNGENFVASDASAVIRHTKNIVYLNDGETATVTRDSYQISTLDKNHRLKRTPDKIDWDIGKAQRGGYKHFMLKEIMEGPEVITNSLRGRLIVEEGMAKLGGLESVQDKIRRLKKMVIVGCGTAYYAGSIGRYMFEEYAGIPTEIEIGSEFRYRKPILDEKTAVLAISQSGETADTLASIKEAKRKNVLTLGIVNAVGSTIARETDAGVYNHAGPEIGVASTKAFLSQLTVLALFTLFLGRQRQMSLVTGKRIATELLALPKKAKKILAEREKIKKLASKYAGYRDFLYIGRKYNFPIAYEGALKIKEVAYVHAEGYGAGEMKHGPIAMIDPNFPTIAIALKDSVYEKMISNIEEIKARGGPIIAVATEGDKEIKKLVDDVIYVPKTLEMLSPVLSVIPLQLFAYYFGVAKGYNVDKPRNLAKSVTVE